MSEGKDVILYEMMSFFDSLDTAPRDGFSL